MARTKGAVAKGVDNTAVRIFLRGYGSLGELPRIVEDCICGALGQEEETRRFKGERILAILEQLDHIDTPTVHRQMWDYNISQGKNTEPSKRNTERMTRVLRCASRALYHHLKLCNGLSREDEVVQISAPDLTVDEIEHARRLALAGRIEEFTQFVNSCRSVIKNYEPPVFKYTGENVVALSSCTEVSLRTAVSRPYYGYVKKAVKDEQPEDLFTVKGSNTNLQPLIEEVGRSYMVVENVA
ncbi:hypothetical protein [Enterobacter sichuanensis]|uniref:hypothetical protein n=1 Tax=Enterobacter sichuanensis TaxID=2071710 RepID=UPI000CEEEFED|nr:hypothetical protein [Enterobacter sichuanensis]MDR0175587.1 hypothetical protein [Enterobacter sichuanensis]